MGCRLLAAASLIALIAMPAMAQKAAVYHAPKNVFMPRFGVAYKLNNTTVVRSGFGMFAGFLGERRGDVFQNGFTQNTNMVLTNDNGLHFISSLANPFPNGVAEPVGATAGPQTFLGQTFSYFNQNPKILRFVMDNPSDRVTYGDLRMLRAEFDDLMKLSLEAGTLKRPVAYERYVDESFVKNLKPVAIAL